MIKINFHDRCMDRGHHGWCSGVHGKTPKKVELVEDNSGIIDIYTEHQLENPVCHSDIRIGWIQENEAINPRYFAKLRSNPSYYFDVLGYDYIYTYAYDLIKSDSRFKYSLGEGFWITEPKIYEKSKLCSIIVSNKRISKVHNLRLNIAYYHKNKYPEIDLFGTGHNEIEFKEQGLCDYMFSFAMENDVVDCMMTEKLFDCFATGTIPLYLGSKKAGRYFNPDGIIFLDDSFNYETLTPELYYSRMDAIKENFELVKEREIPIDYIFKDIYEEVLNEHSMGD